MARFRGTVQGGRGEASRLGHASSGVAAVAQSYSGDVKVSMFDSGGEDYVSIIIGPHGGADFVLYSGPISKLINQSARKTMMQAFVADMLTEEVVGERL